MPTKVTIEYDDGHKQEFVATTDLESAILAGEMFSVTTVHHNEAEVCRMYVGNPMTALGEMIILYRMIHLKGSDMTHLGAVGKCIKLLSDQIAPRSEQSKEVH